MSAFDDKYRSIMRIQEEMARYEAISRTDQQIARLIQIPKDVAYSAQILKELARHDEASRALDAAAASGRQIDKMLTIQDQLGRFYDHLMQPTADIAALEAATRPYVRFLEEERATRESLEWLQLRASLVAQDAWQTELYRIEMQARLTWELHLGTLSAEFASLPGEPSSAVRAAMMDPAYAFSAFTRESVARLAIAPPVEALARTTAIAVAEGQIRTGTEVVGASARALIEHGAADGGSIGGGADHRINRSGSKEHRARSISAVADLTIFSAQYQEILTAGPPPAGSGYIWVLQTTATARAVQLGQRIARTVTEINDACRLSGLDQVFPPTNAMLAATSVVSYPRVHDKVSLGSAVDALYILLYEGSGEMKRVLTWVTDETCRPVWILKHLRNSWLRHDSEHGSAGDKARKAKELKAAFDYLGSNAPPRSSDEYQALFERLLEGLCEFLDALDVAIPT